jgi:hypothetical protein
MATLADRLAARDAERFVGRGRELSFFDDLLVDDPPVNVVLVHGPGGIGKSTLLREVSRRAAERGWRPRFVEGRDLAPAPGELERALFGVAQEERPLVVFDTYDRMSAMSGWLRQRLLPSLPERSLVVIAGRRKPDPEWFQGGWEQMVAELNMGPFTPADARELGRQRGVTDDETLDALLEWAEGSPLALTLGADAARTSDWRPEWLEGRPDLTQAILRRLTEEELLQGEGDVLAVASIARVVTARLLRDVLPGVDADEAESWLRARSFVEHFGHGVALHDLVRKAIRADLKRRRPEHERDLRRRIADHLHLRATRGDIRLIADLADLVENPALRWGMGVEGSIRHRVDALHEDDIPVLERKLRGRIEMGDEAWLAWWEPTERLLRAAPERALVVRDREEGLCGLAYAVTPENAPPEAEADGALGPWIAHAREHAPGGQAMVWRDSIDLTTAREGDVGSPILALMNTGCVLRSGLRNPRWSYLPIDPQNEAAVAFARGVRARHVEELDIGAGSEKVIQCWVLDSGSGGMLGGILKAIYAELGLPRPHFDDAPSETEEPEPPEAVHESPALTADDVRDALRNLDTPTELASSALARGATPEERAASVRAALEEAVESAFGEGAEEDLLRQVLRRGYLDPAGSHESAWWDLHLSRATYFRKLRAASARVAEWLIAQSS